MTPLVVLSPWFHITPLHGSNDATRNVIRLIESNLTPLGAYILLPYCHLTPLSGQVDPFKSVILDIDDFNPKCVTDYIFAFSNIRYEILAMCRRYTPWHFACYSGYIYCI